MVAQIKVPRTSAQARILQNCKNKHLSLQGRGGFHCTFRKPPENLLEERAGDGLISSIDNDIGLAVTVREGSSLRRPELRAFEGSDLLPYHVESGVSHDGRS